MSSHILKFAPAIGLVVFAGAVIEITKSQKVATVEKTATIAVSTLASDLNGRDPAHMSATDYTFLRTDERDGVTYSVFYRKADPEKLPPKEKENPCVEVSLRIDNVAASPFRTRLSDVDRAVNANRAAHNKLEYYCIRSDGFYGQVDFYAHLKPGT
ncbi:MAG: hypothetical protein WAO98_01170 [Alphaproteobacteria bacterium]